MLKIKVNEEKVEMEIHGELTTICAEFTGVVRRLYKSLKEHDEDAGEFFKKMVINDIPKLAFCDNVHDGIKDRLENLKNMAKGTSHADELCDLLDSLKELVDSVKDVSDED